MSAPPAGSRSPRPPVARTTARNAAFINQLATPGLGSLIARRWVAGIGQLLLAIAGAGLVIVWAGNEIFQAYRMAADFNAQIHHVPRRWALAGAGIFVFAWLWALVTSISLLREADREANRQARAELEKPLA